MRITETVSQQILQLLTQYSGRTVKTGETITGRIIALDNAFLLLQLSDGSRISAQVRSDADYAPGDILKLEVMEEKQGQIFVRQVDHIASSTVEKKAETDPAALLKAMNLPADKLRMDIIKAISDSGHEPSVDLIEKTSSMMKEKQLDDPGQAVFLVLNDMEDKEAYFPLTRQFKEGAFQFQERWLDLVPSLKQLDDATIKHIAKGFMIQETIRETDLNDGIRRFAELLSAYMPSEHLDNTATESLFGRVLEAILPGGVNTAEQLVFPENADTLLSFHLEQNLKEWGALPQTQKNEMMAFLKPLLSEFAEKIFHDTKLQSPHQGLKEADYIEKQMAELNTKAWVKSREAALPKIDEWIRDTGDKLRIIKEAVTLFPGTQAGNVLPLIHEMETAIRFFQDIISYETFVQVPLMLKEKTFQGELYVMKRKGRKGKIDAGDFTLFLSMTTENLGVMDTFVHVRNKNVMLRIMMENKAFFEFLPREFKPLFDALKEKGYHLYDLKYSLREEGIDLLNAVRKAAELIPEQNNQIDFKI